MSSPILGDSTPLHERLEKHNTSLPTNTPTDPNPIVPGDGDSAGWLSIRPCHACSRPSLSWPELMLMPSGQAESVRLGLLEIERIVSSLLGQLGPGQGPQNISSEGSVQSNTESNDGAEVRASDDSDDDSDDDIDSDGAGAGEFSTGSPESTRHRSTQRCKWTKEEDDILRRLKNIGALSDIQIARRLNRSENGVKQHWYIMSGANHELSVLARE
ncbi:hypothetical protein EDB80DRAFT_691658 [Ilyonectria destructans]|nr:hypothetical protein EDB80DRAFT_691658 [Ilyonectria destructans]